MYNSTKRLIDILVALTILVVSLPVFLITMLLLSVTGEREIFYFQERIGYKNKRFFIWKFTTMLKGSDKTGIGEFTLANDPRLTPLGNFLRKTKLNELPQVINILKGDMTIVGPRPLTINGFNRYSKAVQSKIYNIKPGITGIGSIVFRNEVSLVNNCTDYEALYLQINAHKGRLELWYQQNRSLKTDFLIVFLTAYTILYPDQNLTYKLFPTLPKMQVEDFSVVVTRIPKRKVSRKVEFGVN